MRFDLIGIGELLMDMTPTQTPQGQAFIPNPGGAPCNFLAMAQKMGAQTAFIGKVGQDQFGLRLKTVIEEVGINTEALVLDSETPTTLAFVHLNEDGDRSFSFYRKGCSDVSLALNEVNLDLLHDTKALYFGSLAFTDEPTKSTAKAIIEKASQLGKLICYDPNYRPLLWKSKEEAVEAMLNGLPYANVLKVSDEEALLLSGQADVSAAALWLADYGKIDLVCVTQGEAGTLFALHGKLTEVPAYSVKAVDTTGAGDAFFGTLMQQIVEALCVQGESKSVMDLDAARVNQMVQKANVAAALCVTGYGAIPALPSREQVENALLSN